MGEKLHNYANTMQLASFGISIWVNNSFNLSKYTYVIMYDNNVCQLNVCDMGAVGRFFKYGGRGQGRTRSFDVTGFASDSAEIWSGGGITPCTPDSDGPVCDMGVYPCQTSVLSPITPSFAFFALFEH